MSPVDFGDCGPAQPPKSHLTARLFLLESHSGLEVLRPLPRSLRGHGPSKRPEPAEPSRLGANLLLAASLPPDKIGAGRAETTGGFVGDVASGLSLRRVQGKGGTEVAVPLPAVARKILGDYIAMVRMKAAPTEPLFVSRFKAKGGRVVEGRMKSHRVWKVTKAIGARGGVPELHPHAFRHSCGVELLRRSNGNLRAVQEHLRHADIQTTTVYTRLKQSYLQKVISAFDNNNRGRKQGFASCPPRHLNSGAENFSNSKLVAPTGFEPVF